MKLSNRAVLATSSACLDPNPWTNSPNHVKKITSPLHHSKFISDTRHTKDVIVQKMVWRNRRGYDSQLLHVRWGFYVGGYRNLQSLINWGTVIQVNGVSSLWVFLNLYPQILNNVLRKTVHNQHASLQTLNSWTSLLLKSAKCAYYCRNSWPAVRHGKWEMANLDWCQHTVQILGFCVFFFRSHWTI